MNYQLWIVGTPGMFSEHPSVNDACLLAAILGEQEYDVVYAQTGEIVYQQR